MKLIADLHIHSHFSRATSKQLQFPPLWVWAQRKGIDIVGTGDISHPGWLAEIQEYLEEAEEGLFRLKPQWQAAVVDQVPPACRRPVRFLLAGEISSIYKHGGKTRKIHNVVFAPSLAAVSRLQTALEGIGNIRSDGRPILGLPARDLLELVLATDERCRLIPAHIWTPWFSLLGSKSGYDTVEACFEDLTPHIFALETGLSSDPPMNWRLSALDRYTLVSNSDAHSPQKLGREATLFDCELSYEALFAAMQDGDPARFKGTLEFFPQEGKYHHDGHRKCGVNWHPRETMQHDGRCVVCGKPVTVGVSHRVEELADRPEGVKKPNAMPFYSLIPLPEVLGELLAVGAGSKRVRVEYERLLRELGPELTILLDLPLASIAKVGGERLAAGIGRMRRGEVETVAGYDGEYGVIKIFGDSAGSEAGQLSFFPHESAPQPAPEPAPAAPVLQEKRLLYRGAEGLTSQQQRAVQTVDRPLVILAGPGAGKTRTLTARIAYLLQARGVAPESVLAITFTNKAAQEMRERLQALVGRAQAERLTIQTFHAFGAQLLRTYGARLGLPEHFVIVDDAGRENLLQGVSPSLKQRDRRHLLDAISAYKNNPTGPEPEGYASYQAALRTAQAVDFDDLIALAVTLLSEHEDVRKAVQARYRWISVDEYQDVNAMQYRLLKLLAAAGANVCVIGDPDQAIYGFRGADYRYFMRFEKDFDQAVCLVLNQNFRSSQTILQAAQQVISRNPDRQDLELLASFANDVKLEIYEAPSERAEAEYIVHQIEDMMGGVSYFSLDSGRVADETAPAARSFADFAVLYRLKAQAQPLIEAFTRLGIPFQTAGATPLWERTDVRTLLAYLWLRQNPHAQPYATLASDPQLRQLVLSWQDSLPELMARLGAALNVAAAPLAHLQALAAPYAGDERAFLEMSILGSETDLYDERADRVSLLTLHAAKGLEFPVVFIAGCEDGILPYQRGDEAEERRLFYVGMTRAKEKLVLSHARRRFLYGQTQQQERSPFVDDIEQALLVLQRSTFRRRSRGPQAEQLSLF